MSYAAASFNLGIGLGAAFGFVGSWRNANLAAASLCAANLIFVAATDTPPDHAGKGGKVSGVRRAATAPEFLGVLGASLGHGGLIGAATALLPLAMRDLYGTDPWQPSLLFLCCGGFQMVWVLVVLPHLASRAAVAGAQYSVLIASAMGVALLVSLGLALEFVAPLAVVFVIFIIAYVTVCHSSPPAARTHARTRAEPCLSS